MPNEARFDVPFIPQNSVTEQILAAIHNANQNFAQRAELALRQQAQPSENALRQSQTALANAQVELDKMNMGMRQELLHTLWGVSPSTAAPNAVPTPPTGAPVPVKTAGQGDISGQPAPTPEATASQAGAPAQSGADVIRSMVARANAAPAPASTPAKSGGLIADTVNSLLQTPGLSLLERNAILNAGNQARVKALLDPQNAMDSITSTYNQIVKEHGENARAIKTENVPDSQSSTGYSIVATTAEGREAYRHAAPAPMPKNLEEASSYLGSASLAYQRDPTPGNKAALTLSQVQHDAMYKDRILEASQQAAATARAQGRDYEAMIRTGKNPITGEVLSLSNAPPGALVNPSTGQPVPQDMVSLYKPTMTEKQTADTARQVLAISQGLKEQIAKNPALIGPIAGRSQEALQSLGLSARDASKLIDDVTFLQSAATKMHTGRFSNAILDKMSSVIKPGMNAQEFLGALDSVNDVAGRYANEDKLTTVYEFQQCQQFEGQGGAAPPPGQFSPGNPFAPKR